MKKIILVAFALSAHSLFAQNGYLITTEDSVLTGYLRHYVSVKDGHRGIELWRTKKDTNPRKIPKAAIEEYAIKNDTFKVFRQFRPFQDNPTYFEEIDGKLKSRGKVNLYIIENYRDNKNVSVYTGGGAVPAVISLGLGYTYMYVLQEKETGFYKALPSRKEDLMEVLTEFFPERYIIRYNQEKSQIKYKEVPALVKLYNSK